MKSSLPTKLSSSVLLGLVIVLSMSSCDFLNGLLPSAETSNIEGYAFTNRKERDKWGIVDANGRVIVEDEWKEMPSAPKEGMVFVQNKKGEYEFFTVKEKPKKIGNEFKSVLPFCDGLAAVVEPNKTISFINKTGEIEFKLDKGIVAVRSFSEGLAPYMNKDGEWGFINRSGKEEVKAKWTDVGNFSSGLAMVKTYDKVSGTSSIAFIDIKGNEVFALKDKYNQAGSFYEGRCMVLDDDEWGFIDVKGDEVIKCKWTTVTQFRDGLAAYQDEGEWGIIDQDGESVLRAKYKTDLAASFIFPRSKDIFFEIDGDEIEAFNFKGDKLFSVDGTQILPFCNDFTVVNDDGDFYFLKANGEAASDQEFTYVDLNGVSIFSDQYLNSKSVVSDFFDVGLMVSGLKVKPAITLGYTVAQIMESHGIEDTDLPQSKWGGATSLSKNLDLGDGQNASVEYVFFTDVTTPERKNVTTTNYWGKPVTKLDFTGEFITEKNAKVRYVQWKLNPTGKGNGKEKMIAEAILGELKAAYPTVKIEADESNTDSGGSFKSVDKDGNSENESVIIIRLGYAAGSTVEFFVLLPDETAEIGF